jgi:restriction system protein
MAIPDYQTIMLPLLKFAGDNEEHSLQEAVENLADYFELTDEELRELLPSGQQAIFRNRVGWARSYMKQAILLESTRRGYIRITPRGLDVIRQNPSKITVKFLDQFEEFCEFRKRRKIKPREEREPEEQEQRTPEEILETVYENLRNELADDILQQISKSTSRFFERIVVEVIVKMGYGGSLRDAGKAIGRSGDEGIDGIIKEDKLGLDIIYIQAKRWENTVGRPEIHRFAGALHGKHARKGVFITTSNFSKEALEYVTNIDSKIILIDGEQLARYMIDLNVGVSQVSIYEVKRIDLDFFIDE